ncbi:protein kinase [Streptomyces sp. NPDC037389]|uniref:serine/threonine-protein kinase n=1 Tax=Streptomyces sp. NPDC037389 TaxID=3155369 RepID=UPI0033DC3B5B
MTTGEPNGGDLAGKVLGGRYRVTATLGRGGMGVVARAVDELLDREVAVKVLRAYTDTSGPDLADLRARMRREAQAAARIRHSGVVTVHDVTEDQGLPVIVMELVDGPSLDDVLSERGTLEPHEAAAIGAKLMDALDAAHRAGVLHRDVKPGNVLLERGGRIVLTDFGIATVDTTGDDAMAKLTRSGEIIGSLDYLPPERAQGVEPGPASDIWSLGMTLYAAVEGASPFRRTSVWSTLTAIVNEPLPEPKRAGALTPVLRALMAKEPEDRPTADQAREMLERVAAGRTVNLAPPSPSIPPAVAPSAPLPPAAGPAAAGPAAAGPAAAGPAAAAPQTFGAFGHPPTMAVTPPPQPVAGAGAAPFAQPAPLPPQPGYGYPPPATAGRYPQPAHPATPAPARPGRARRRSRALIAGAAAAVVLAGGGVSYALMGEHGGKRDDVPQASSPGPSSAADGGMVTAPSEGPPVGPSGSPSQPAPSGTPDDGKRDKASPSATPGDGKSPKTSPSASSTVSKSCVGWDHKDPKPGTYGYMIGTFKLGSGPYASCPTLAEAKSGVKVWFHCYITNNYGHRWTYVRIEGTKSMGWMYNGNINRQNGPDTPCN